jgi:long-chain acyl-CoA synthetase
MDDEILIRHEGMMTGYYRDPEQTRASFTEDGFLRTGDRGQLDADGFLRIIGRTKELFKTSKGKYVVPGPIEMMIGEHSDVEMSCVTGEAMPQPIALITLTETGRSRDRRQIREELMGHIQRINSRLDAHEKIGKAIVLEESWTIENNMLTPTLKLKRREIEGSYGSLFEVWCSEEELVVMM